MTNIVQFPSSKEVSKEDAKELPHPSFQLSTEDQMKIKIIVLLLKEHSAKDFTIEESMEAFGCTEEQLTKMAYGEVDKLALVELLAIVDSSSFMVELSTVGRAEGLIINISKGEE